MLLFEQEETERTEGLNRVSFQPPKSWVIVVHPLFSRASELTHDVIGAAIEVHKDKGPGLLESIYEWCLARELDIRGFSHECQSRVVIRYKQFERTENLKFDLLVNQCLLIEIKAVDNVLPIHKAQLLSYMKLLDVPLGLLINFNTEKLTDGVQRMMLAGANVKEEKE